MKFPALLRFGSRSLIAEDAEALIASHADEAYEHARTRAREERLGTVIDANRPRGHWDKVSKEIARRTGR